MSGTCSPFPLFGDPWPSCLLPSQIYRVIHIKCLLRHTNASIPIKDYGNFIWLHLYNFVSHFIHTANSGFPIYVHALFHMVVNFNISQIAASKYQHRYSHLQLWLLTRDLLLVVVCFSFSLFYNFYHFCLSLFLVSLTILTVLIFSMKQLFKILLILFIYL